jgi:hypothetical protein
MKEGPEPSRYGLSTTTINTYCLIINGVSLQKKREFRKIPHVEFDTPHGMAYVTATTTDDLERAKIQKRNYVKNPTEFKDSYTAITTLTEKLQTNTKFQG